MHLLLDLLGSGGRAAWISGSETKTRARGRGNGSGSVSPRLSSKARATTAARPAGAVLAAREGACASDGESWALAASSRLLPARSASERPCALLDQARTFWLLSGSS